jgi:hypothetical protein
MIIFLYFFGKEFKNNFDGNIMETFGNQNQQKLVNIFCCNLCDYTTSRKYNYDIHINSLKHKNGNQMETFGNKTKQIQQIQQNISNPEYLCDICSKKFKHRSGLWKHNNKYHLQSNEKPSNLITTELVLELIKDNKELKELIFQQHNTLNTIVNDVIKNGTQSVHNTSNTTNNNSHNKAFNLNMYLNETCKEAINISDFVNSIKVSFDDLENTGRKGYIEGITNIIAKNLNKVEPHFRSIHCSDYKREIIYIKNNDKWEKETDDKPILTKAIKTIANANIKQIQGWREKYPDCILANSKKNNLYLKIVSNSMIGLTEEEGHKNINKIINNVAKETIIQKYI